MAVDLEKRFRARERILPDQRKTALRTAFIARFIVLREGRKSRAHRLIERLRWGPEETAEGLKDKFRAIFVESGEENDSFDRDLERALEHANESVDHFVSQYAVRSTLSFAESLRDYLRSNMILFGDDIDKFTKKGGWRIPPPKKKPEFGKKPKGRPLR